MIYVNLLTLLFILDAISCKNFNNHILCGACVFGYKSIETGYTSLVAEATVFLQGDIVDYQKIETKISVVNKIIQTIYDIAA